MGSRICESETNSWKPLILGFLMLKLFSILSGTSIIRPSPNEVRTVAVIFVGQGGDAGFNSDRGLSKNQGLAAIG